MLNMLQLQSLIPASDPDGRFTVKGFWVDHVDETPSKVSVSFMLMKNMDGLLPGRIAWAFRRLAVRTSRTFTSVKTYGGFHTC